MEALLNLDCFHIQRDIRTVQSKLSSNTRENQRERLVEWIQEKSNEGNIDKLADPQPDVKHLDGGLHQPDDPDVCDGEEDGPDERHDGSDDEGQSGINGEVGVFVD